MDNKTILITGGTGTFGKSFTKLLLEQYNPKKVIIYSRDEFKQDNMKKEFSLHFPNESKKLRFFIGDVRDKERLCRAFEGVDYVIHAAAMKQVPACEYNPFEAVKTNIEGAKNIIDAALDLNVKKVIALSTDKAVNPVNLYGGTKMVSDKLFIAANAYAGEKHDTIFSVVRYGNVSGSRGSIIPFFRELLNEGVKELPITDVEMTRFWMTTDKAVSLVLKALEESKMGETFVFKNPSYKVIDIAKAMSPNFDPKIVGIREGEKIHEVMVSRDDSRYTRDYGDYYIIYPNFEWWNQESFQKKGGEPVELGWEYSSGNNTQWLDVDELRSLITQLGL